MNRLAFYRKQLTLETLECRVVPAWFMKMDTIPGESLVPPLLDGPAVKIGTQFGGPGNIQLLWIDTGTGASRPSINDIAISRSLSSASPNLLKSAISGARLPEITLGGHTGNNVGMEFLKLELKDVLVTGFSHVSGRGGDLLVESISLNFNAVSVNYRYYAYGTLKYGVNGAAPVLQPNQNIPMDAFFCGNPGQGANNGDTKGAVTKVTRIVKHPDGSMTTTEYDGKGNITKVTKVQKQADGSTRITEADGKGNVTKVTIIKTEKNGNKTTTEYDGKGNVTRTIVEDKDKDGSSVVREYDGKGKLVRKTETQKNADGSTTVTVTEHTKNGKVVKKTITGKDKNGATVIVEFVGNTRVKITKIEKDKNGDTTTTEYDGKGKVTKKTVTHKNEDGSTTTTEYDAKGNKTKITKVEKKADGTTTTTEADGDGNIKKVTEEKTEADGSKTITEYEGKGKLE